jgi:CheY-like chemotaxis protein
METKNRVVLVVDDDPAVRDLERAMLRQAGYEVVPAVDGAVAIEELKARRPDLVLLDLVMPNVDGWGVLEHIRGMDSPPPVVVVSGMHEIVPPGHLTRYVTGYVFKPFDLKQLLRMCAAAMAAPGMEPVQGTRREGRRNFIVETTLVSEAGTPLVRGHLLQLSRGGFRLELAIPLQTGDPVRVTFRIPGHAGPLLLKGHVRWHHDLTLGAEIDELTAEDEKILRDLVTPES